MSDRKVNNLNTVSWEILSKILCNLEQDIQSLFRCTAVSKSLRTHIASSEFQKLWQNQCGEYVDSTVLLERSKFYIHHKWIPGDDVSRFSFNCSTLLPKFQGVEIVASSHGLVCAKAFLRKRVGVFWLIVGNPIINCWTELPDFEDNPFNGETYVEFRMAVMELNTGSYKVAAFNNYNISSCKVYDSCTNRWYTLQSSPSKWYGNISSDSKPVAIRTGHEMRHSHVLVDNQFCVWRYSNGIFLGGAWGKFRENGEGLGVWRVDRDKLVKIDAVKYSKILPDYEKEKIHIICNADANVVCFRPSKNTLFRPIVYDIKRATWTNLEVSYSQAVAYRPSMIQPQRAGIAVDETMRDMETIEWHFPGPSPMPAPDLLEFMPLN